MFGLNNFLIVRQCQRTGLPFLGASFYFLMSVLSTSAEIVHTNSALTVNLPLFESPDVVVPIDLNADSIADFEIRLSTGSVCVCLPGDAQPPFWHGDLLPGPGASDQQVIGSSSILALAKNQIIDVGQDFNSSPDGLLFSAETVGGISGFLQIYSGEFDQTLDYVGVRFNIGPETYFGWLSFQVTLLTPINPGFVTIGDFAFEDTGNLILAGQTSEQVGTDLNGDGTTNHEDLLIWTDAYNSSTAGDADENGVSNGLDFLQLQIALGDSTSPPIAQTVPEPRSYLLLAIAIAIVVPVVRKR